MGGCLKAVVGLPAFLIGGLFCLMSLVGFFKGDTGEACIALFLGLLFLAGASVLLGNQKPNDSETDFDDDQIDDFATDLGERLDDGQWSPPTPDQLEFCRRLKIRVPTGCGKWEVSDLIEAELQRRKQA
jgi:hypothetical protein